MRDRITDPATGLVAAGFSPPEALARLADHLAWAGLFLSDVGRGLYELLGLVRAPLWRVYSPGTLAHYAVALARGQHLSRPVEDTRQMGGDAVAVDGVVRVRWRSRSPDDRVSADEVARTAARLAGEAS